jgi:ElaB/YqjD/DUF883 family membrane-anchored ribosome-binding protein
MEAIIPVEPIGEGGIVDKVKERMALPWQDILDKMENPELDAFQRMKIALYELFPAITEKKETDLKELAENFEDIVDLDELVEKAQTLFNDAKNATGDELNEITLELNKTLDQLRKGLETASTPSREGPAVMDPDLGEKLIATVDKMQADISADKLQSMWSGHNHSNNTTSMTNIETLKKQLDGYYELGAGISGFSASLQTRLQFEIGNYQQFLATNNEMYHQDSATTKVHVNRLTVNKS